MGKVGAIIADVVFGYVTQRVSFYLSAAFGIVGAIVTIIFLPDTTGMSLDELVSNACETHLSRFLKL